MGGNNYKHLVPSGFYIDVNDYKSVKDLTDYLNYLDTNPVSYSASAFSEIRGLCMMKFLDDNILISSIFIYKYQL